MEQLAVGDVVRTNVGPKMTVEKVDREASEVDCVWFDSNDHLQRDTLLAEILIKVD